jgi:hypothetical protein
MAGHERAQSPQETRFAVLTLAKGRGMHVKRGSRQRREGEADGPWGRRPARISHKLDGVRQTGASGRSSVERCGHDKPCRSKGRWAGSAWLVEEAVRRLLHKEPATPGRLRESTGELNGCQTSQGGRAGGSRRRFQPCWGKPTARNEWRGRGKQGQQCCVRPRPTRLPPTEGNEGTEETMNRSCAGYRFVQAVVLRSEVGGSVEQGATWETAVRVEGGISGLPAPGRRARPARPTGRWRARSGRGA